MEIYNGESYDIYHYTFGSEPKSILQNREDRLSIVIEEDGREILVFKDENYLLTFYEYDYITQEMIELHSLQSLGNTSHSDEVVKIEDSKYLLQLNDGVHGLEPWVYNSENLELKLLKDMNEKYYSSRSASFTFGPDNELYFTAFKETKDRQLFKLDKELTSVKEIQGIIVDELVVYPSPSEGSIQLLEDHLFLQIFSMKGQLLYQEANYHAGAQIDLSHLENNIYILKSMSGDGGSRYCKFSIVGD